VWKIIFWHFDYRIPPPAGRGAFISQLRVWPFSSSVVAALSERSQNPSSRLAGEGREVFASIPFYLSQLAPLL
jgi:hypothetical protein